MVEDSKDKPSSQQKPSDAEKNVQPAAGQQPPSAPSTPAATAPSPRPPTAQPPARPPQAAPPAAPARGAQPKSVGRRTFVKALFTVGAVLSIVPFVPWGSFLSSSISGTGIDKRQKLVVDNDPDFGAAAGKTVNVNDLENFPPNTGWLITYPSLGDLSIDTNNKDTFVKYQLIRLPSGELGGEKKEAASFVAFSEICVHLWCSPQFKPSADSAHAYQCPCHGTQYEIPDGLATLGPAAVQPAPTNAIPMLTLTADASGDLYAEVPVWDVDHNGVLGYGRNASSYASYIRPAARGSGT